MASPPPPAPLLVAVGGSSRLIRESLASLLHAAPGFEVTVVEARRPADAALALPPAIVLWEVTADGDPLSALRVLRARFPSPTPVLLVGPPPSGPDLAALLQGGSTGFAALDSSPAELVSLLRQTARGEAAISPKLAASLFAAMAQGEAKSSPAESIPPSDRELDVLRLVASGATNKQIAQRLYLSVRTVEGHLARLYSKLGVTTRTEAALVAIRRGWARIDDAT